MPVRIRLARNGRRRNDSSNIHDLRWLFCRVERLDQQSDIVVEQLEIVGHLLFSADLNAACPNSVIEALACGTPVIGFDTGALRELVPETCGKVVPYGGDPWKLDKPDIPALAAAAAGILRDRPRYSRAARAHAQATLGLEAMVDGYLRALLEA